MTPIIHAEHLGKRYQLGQRARHRPTLRETLVRAVSSPWERLRRLAGRAPEGETFWALDDVSFDVQPGEAIGIIGRNGAGKSTLLKILSQITEPTRGRVELRGRVASLLEVGTGFHSELTGCENIFLNGAILGMTRAEIRRKFDEIVAFAEVERFLDTQVKHYSIGMYMRLAFAVAAHLDPEILIVDEVLAVGDAEFQKKCLGKMSGVAKSGRTVLFVSHNMLAVEQLCDRAMLLQAGRTGGVEHDVRATIQRYLFGDHDSGSSAVWVNDGRQFVNPWFRPLRLSIVLEDTGLPAVCLGNNDDAWIQIEAVVEKADAALTVGYTVYGEDGQLLYRSLQTDAGPERTPPLQPGRCILASRFPKRLLNEGVYRFELFSSIHHREWLIEPGVTAPGINVTIQGGLSDSPFWLLRRPGVLAPVLPWQATQLPARANDERNGELQTPSCASALDPTPMTTGRHS